ncbi:SCO6745 family protein [Geodermatophilus sp. URMC 64]
MVSVDHLALDPRVVARAHRAVEPLHNHLYFAPEHDEHLTAVGLRPGRMCYFAGRAAPMGRVGPGVVAATFYNFAPALVARHIPRAWTLAEPEQVVAARFDAARASLTRLLGADVAGSPEIAELAELVREACGVLTAEARPLYAGHADLPWPEEPLLVLWHGATLLREHRGDGHLAALLRAGLTGLEALITHTVTGRGFTESGAKATRGWSDEDWAATTASLTERELLADGQLTPDGAALRAQIEVETDEMSAAPWEHLGAERTARVVDLGKALSARLVAAGAYPSGLLAGR